MEQQATVTKRENGIRAGKSEEIERKFCKKMLEWYIRGCRQAEGRRHYYKVALFWS